MARRLRTGVIVLYVVFLFVLWTLWVLVARPWLAGWASDWGAMIVEGVVKLLIWTAFAAVMTRRYHGSLAVETWFGGRIKAGRLALWTVGILLYGFVSGWLLDGSPAIQPSFSAVRLVEAVLLVGITEEAVFRGFLLSAFFGRMRKRPALAVSALLFVLIHFPTWYSSGLFLTPLDLLRSCFTIFVLGILFGWFYLEDRNLLSPMLLHMAWNAGVLLFHG